MNDQIAEIGNLLSALFRVGGSGAASEAVRHWSLQRLTALALIPLGLWFAVSVMALAGADYESVVGWFGAPLNAILLALLIIATFYHLVLGVEAVVEDYVHDERWKRLVPSLLRSASLVLTGAGLFAVLRIALGS
jgi:succinate dehydrogenase / fumarate reductase, membrane anchor subunit